VTGWFEIISILQSPFKMSIKSNISVLFFLLFFLPATTQTPPVHFTALTAKDGLLSNTVNAILKDRYGLMWFATDDGLNKFDGTNFTTYRHIAGDSSSLRANEILALHEDKEGNLWVGTSGGAISFYDRKKDVFVNYPTEPVGGGMSPNSVVRRICSDYLGKIWIAQYEAPYILDPKTKTIVKVSLNVANSDTVPETTLFCVFEDSKRRLWVGTDHGLFLYQRPAGSFKRFHHDDSDKSSLTNDKVKAIVEDKTGNLWIGTEGGLCMLQSNQSGFKCYTHEDGNNASLSSNQIDAIAADNAGRLWLGTPDGLNILDIATGKVSLYKPDPKNVHSLTSKFVRCVYIDQSGICWMGTFRGGINKYDKNLNLFNLKRGDEFQEHGSNGVIAGAFAELKDGNILVGTDGNGLLLFEHKNEQLKRVNIALPNTNSATLSVLALEKTKNNKIYIGTFANGLILLDPVSGKQQHFLKGDGMQDLNANDIFCIKEDSKGNVWIGTNGSGVNVLNNNKVVTKFCPRPKAANEIALPVNGYIRAIEEDPDGNIWIASHGDGIAIYNTTTSKFTVYNQANSRLSSDKIQALLLDSRGQMWAGTYGGGLSVFNRKNGQFTTYSEKDGLQNTTIYQIVEDLQGQIWVSTNTGISCFDVTSRKFRNFTHYNGIQNNNFVHGSGKRTSSGELFFGGLQGFNYFNPAQLTINKNVPTVLITDLKISNKSVVPGDNAPITENISIAKEIRLEYKQNFALSFVALNYTIPKQNQYSYKLEGFDKDWTYIGSTNTVSYTNLDPGNYTFKVKASNNDGVWSTSETYIKIYVKPPFWRTIYAYILYGLSLGGLLLYSRHRGIAKLKKRFALMQERQEANRIQELDRLKLKFLTNLSHEFRTPISLIMGPVDQLISEEKNTRPLAKLHMVKRNTRRLLNLVNQLLDFRKMEEQELKLQLSEGEFVSFVKDVADSFTDLSERKHINFEFKSSVPRLEVLFDRDKTERILFNLLSNAFKFTFEGGTIILELDELENKSDSKMTWLSLKVTDTGIGIPSDKKEEIFDRFFQYPSGNAILNQGTGIGLSITKEFVKMHGGNITVESEPGKGSTFTIIIPLEKIAIPRQATNNVLSIPDGPVVSISDAVEKSELIKSGSGNKIKLDDTTILLVEDNEDFRFYLKDNLKSNYKIIEASDGNDGWQKALAYHPQLIVSDISMPYMDGIALSQKLKADKRTTHIPVILLTALNNEEQQLKGLEAGANDYITKPFNFEVLNAKIKNLLELKNTFKTTYSKQIKILGPDINIESSDEKLLHTIAGYLEENIMNPQLSVESLSKRVGMSRSSLYNKLLEITGQTPVEYIRSFKLEKAASLLEKTDMTIAEITYMVGFSKPNYFAKAFKSKYNMSPSEFATSLRKENNQNGSQ
jgi:signal transduction histidine kinase/ligand-binding sensor domain-containing protein/DNA-binding response OmpR family regulator